MIQQPVVRQPVPARQGTPMRTNPPAVAQIRQPSTFAQGGGGKYLPPVKEVMNAPKPPPFGRQEEAVAQQTAPPRQPAVPRPQMIVRGQAPGDDGHDGPVPQMGTSTQLPSREELGLLTSNRPPPVEESEWNNVRAQLDRWQATSYRLEKTASGQYRFLCVLPYSDNPGRQRQFEATAATENEAMRLAMGQAQTWLSTR